MMNFEKLTIEQITPCIIERMKAEMGVRGSIGTFEVKNPHFYDYTDDGARYTLSVVNTELDCKIATTFTFSLNNGVISVNAPTLK